MVAPRQEEEQLGEDSPSAASRKGVGQSAPEDNLENRQQTDPGLLDMIQYLENNILRMTRVLALSSCIGINIQLLKECYTTLLVTRHFALLFLIPTQ